MVKKTTAKDGDHVVTMREVAKAAGVSIKTVSNVVNDYEFVSDATRAKVHKAIDELGYVINVSARNLRRGSAGIIALAIPDLQLSYFAQLSSLIITEAKKLGLRVIVEPTLYSREGELDALHGSQTAMVDGLIYSPLELGPDDAAEVEVDYPLVLIGERIFTDKVDHIATENVEGAKRATSYLLQTGCKRVAVVGVHPGEEVGSAALRFRGYREALEEAGVPFDPALVVPSIMWHRNDGVAAMNTLLDSGVRPDGVVALNDMLASGVMHSIQMHDLRIPEDISVIGFDNSDDSQYLSPALTSIAPGLEAVARLSVRALKNHGGVAKADLGKENLPALEQGLPNLLQHVENITTVYHLPCVVAINAFPTDTKAELDLVESKCRELGVNVRLSEVWAKGGEGGEALAREVIRLCEQPNDFTFAYDDGLSIEEINLAMIQNLKEQAGIHSELVGSVIDAVAEVIHSEDEVEIYTSGATNIFRYPELSNNGKASELISTFEEKQQLSDLVNQTLENSDNKGIQVYIGQETPIQSMKDCSVVTATYELGEGLQGTIGIIGPKRMDYENVLKTLKTLTEQLDEIYNRNKK